MADEKDAGSDLDVLFPESKTVSVAGVDVVIAPPTVLQMAKLGKSLRAVIADGAAGSTVEMLMLSHIDEVLDMVAMATSQPRERIESLRSDDGLRLAIAVWDVYAPFFVRRLLPMFAQAMANGATYAGLTRSKG